MNSKCRNVKKWYKEGEGEKITKKVPLVWKNIIKQRKKKKEKQKKKRSFIFLFRISESRLKQS